MKSVPWIAILAVFALARPAHAIIKRDLRNLKLEDAEQRLSEWGVEAQEFIGTAAGNNIATLIGFRGVGFMTENLYFGGAGYGGAFTSGSLGASTNTSNGIGYGGLVSGYQGRIAENVSFDAGFLIGGGGTEQSGSIAIQPRLGASEYLGGGIRITGEAGYLVLPALTGVSGFTFALRLDFKRFNLSFPE